MWFMRLFPSSWKKTPLLSETNRENFHETGHRERQKRRQSSVTPPYEFPI